MITVLINATIKPAYIEEFKQIASLLTKESRRRRGCVYYSFNQRIDSPNEFVLYEQWQSQSDLDAHIQALIVLLGPPRTGEMLPKKLLNMYEKAEPVFYNTIE
ncbi:putative quinol monooxygenase [Psychromonas sp. Urea-02u-13]|uniref:putative quinol monooxygenase n=1 Tax=Psychromonas sp. Urea-02u-13 TaxID=2058326 RepID=UPI000C33CC85|nr:putative quinol monooxygenase [Psychromonas sp. Urea-02u-13]PKG38279.1 hypothetical protein CXF74_14275 [Psychromonas sp. Urea-02u-13]